MKFENFGSLEGMVARIARHNDGDSDRYVVIRQTLEVGGYYRHHLEASLANTLKLPPRWEHSVVDTVAEALDTLRLLELIPVDIREDIATLTIRRDLTVEITTPRQTNDEQRARMKAAGAAWVCYIQASASYTTWEVERTRPR